MTSETLNTQRQRHRQRPDHRCRGDRSSAPAPCGQPQRLEHLGGQRHRRTTNTADRRGRRRDPDPRAAWSPLATPEHGQGRRGHPGRWPAPRPTPSPPPGVAFVNHGTLRPRTRRARQYAVPVNLFVGDNVGGDNADLVQYAATAGTDQIERCGQRGHQQHGSRRSERRTDRSPSVVNLFLGVGPLASGDLSPTGTYTLGWSRPCPRHQHGRPYRRDAGRHHQRQLSLNAGTRTSTSARAC